MLKYKSNVGAIVEWIKPDEHIANLVIKDVLGITKDEIPSFVSEEQYNEVIRRYNDIISETEIIEEQEQENYLKTKIELLEKENINLKNSQADLWELILFGGND